MVCTTYSTPNQVPSRGDCQRHILLNLCKASWFVSPSGVYIWPDPEGIVRGQAIAPLYRSVPQAAKNDPKLYALLSLIDAIRVGRVREQRLAIGELEKRIVTL
jgi:hypothetical protein